MGCDFTNRKPSHTLRRTELPVSLRCGTPFVRINSGNTTLGKATTAVTMKVDVIPNSVIAPANMSGATIAPIWNVAVLAVTACMR